MESQYVQFFTSTVLNWIPLLSNDGYKKVITDSLAFLVKRERCRVYAFVIMPNHIHLIWKIAEGHKRADVQRDFLKFTAQQLRFKLIDNQSPMLVRFRVEKNDRQYQIWQRRPLSVDLYSREVIEQKLDYIHANPVSGKWNLVEEFTDYQYSSASFYELDKSKFKFLSHYMEYFGH